MLVIFPIRLVITDYLLDLKIRKKMLSPLLIFILSVLALNVFLYGFFPLKYSSDKRSNRFKAEIKNKSRYIDKLAFIVIDALRYDFVKPPGDQKYMPFILSSILNREACYTVIKAHSPTVTLPRLKAITSGSVSTYIDVLLNFMTPAFEEDNFINIAVSKGLKLVFYGDDTWLKLFPDSFIRSEGTNSFFAYDYVEVDNNVTRHIDDELKRNDWDIIILHYLGLDHIGHTEGPSSALIKPKLLEMDDIVKRFNDHFKLLHLFLSAACTTKAGMAKDGLLKLLLQEKHQNLKTMLIVTGDHGMKDSGSHGGVTYPEVTVPLVSVGHPCVKLPGWPESHIPLQIDLAPTLSTAFGLPIPGNSMGKLIPSLLHNMSNEDILKNLEINRLELNKLRGATNQELEMSAKNDLELKFLNNYKSEEVRVNITKMYFQNLNQISQELVSTNLDFKLLFLFFGNIALWISLFFLLYEFINQCPKPQTCLHWFFIIGIILHGISLFSSSFIEEEHQTWYFLWTTFFIITFLEILGLSKTPSTFHVSKFSILWVFMALLHRVLRKLNQTGDKWASLPDIKIYLYSEEGQFWLFFIFLLGIAMIFCCALSERCSKFQLIPYGISLFSVVGFRISTGHFKLQYLFFYPSSRGVLEVFAFWISMSIFLAQTLYNGTPSYLVWLLLNSLLQRPHNIILLPIEVFTSKTLYKLFHKSEDVIWNSIAHVWLGNVFYFYQGNGNSLSNVDVAAGFVGIQKYNPIYAGVMIAAHTFNSHILSYNLSPKSDIVYAFLRITPLTLYCTFVIFKLNHLFIWSVFSPKLLFESSITVILLLLLIFGQVINSWRLVKKHLHYSV